MLNQGYAYQIAFQGECKLTFYWCKMLGADGIPYFMTLLLWLKDFHCILLKVLETPVSCSCLKGTPIDMFTSKVLNVEIPCCSILLDDLNLK